MSEPNDVLLRYCMAMDAGDVHLLVNILDFAVLNPGLYAAISALHRRFGIKKTWTQQLLSYRKQFQENREW